MATETLTLNGHQVEITNTEKVFFPAIGATKGDLVRYYLAVAPGALRSAYDRPTLLKRHPNGVEGDFFYQKRVPQKRPPWLHTATVTFPSERTAEFLCLRDEASLAWMANLGCLEINPWAVRSDDTHHPDELRIDLDPTPGIPWDDVRRIALLCREVLLEFGLDGYPRTSGKRGIHVLARIQRGPSYTKVRRAALAFAREVERRAPAIATTAWWKEERTGVFIDYNMNARDRTLASAYSVRAMPDARVATPIAWDEVAAVEPEAFTMLTVPQRFATVGDPASTIDDVAYSIEALLELADRDEKEGLGDAPWPPHFPKGDKEPPRVSPSRKARIEEWERMGRPRGRGKPRG